MDNSKIFKESNYSEIFKENTASRSFLNIVLIIVLISFISGSLGYYFGVSGFFTKISDAFDLSNTSVQNPDAKIYTEAELREKINSNAYDLDLYLQIVANLKDKYVDPSQVTDEKLFDGSLKGLVSSIGDNPTVYMNKDDYKKYREGFSGTFEGIGVRLEYDKNRVVVSDVIEGSPAKSAGVQQGYIFMNVDDKNVEASTIDEVVEIVRGPANSKVKIKFYDPVTNQNIEKEINRAPITIESMRLIEKDSETVVFEVSRFTEDTLDQWTQKWNSRVQEIQSKGYKNIILDLRGNPGGYLNAAIYASNDFLPAGKLVLTERSRSEGDRQNKTTSANPRLKDKNVIILVNGGTASAAEILAGSLRQNDSKYKIIGTRTYGKGTVQETFNLPNSGALKITTEYWLLPNGKKLDNQNPIEPDQELEQDQKKLREGEDNIMNEALKQVKAQ